MSIKQAIFEVELELEKALFEWPIMASPHEGWAIIKEEEEELWREVQKNKGKSELEINAHKKLMRNEAKQVAAMALRFMIELT